MTWFYLKLAWTFLVLAVPFLMAAGFMPLRWERAFKAALGLAMFYVLLAVAALVVGIWS